MKQGRSKAETVGETYLPAVNDSRDYDNINICIMFLFNSKIFIGLILNGI